MKTQFLTAEDLAILNLESDTIAGHTCKAGTVKSDAPSLRQFRTVLAERVQAAPRLTERLANPPLKFSKPAWVLDSEFDIRNHVIQVTDTSQRSTEEFHRLVAEKMARRLDRSRPLWKIYLVPNLEGNRWGFIWLLHHAMADGGSTVELAKTLLWDSEVGGGPVTTETAKSRRERSKPPTFVESTAATVTEQLAELVHSGRTLSKALTSPSVLKHAAVETAKMPAALRRELSASAVDTPLAVKATPKRSVAVVQRTVKELKDIEHRYGEGITVNDVVLAAVAGGLRYWLQSRKLPLNNLRVKVPTSLHPKYAEAHFVGNRDSFIVVDLPLQINDPVKRLKAIAGEAEARKRQHDAEEVDFFERAVRVLPGPVKNRVNGRVMRPEVFTLNVSNVVGPQEQQTVFGGELESFFSLAEIAQQHALRVAVFSMAGQLTFGLCANAEALHDVEVVAEGINQEIDCLRR